ncbi:MAG: type II toxin-antitoxin system RelE family toxin [Phycisphaerae bacterium]
MPTVDAEIQRLSLVIRGRVWDVVARLEHWPQVSGAKPLTGPLAGRFRIRTGDCRVQFRIAKGYPCSLLVASRRVGITAFCRVCRI